MSDLLRREGGLRPFWLEEDLPEENVRDVGVEEGAGVDIAGGGGGGVGEAEGVGGCGVAVIDGVEERVVVAVGFVG